MNELHDVLHLQPSGPYRLMVTLSTQQSFSVGVHGKLFAPSINQIFSIFANFPHVFIYFLITLFPIFPSHFFTFPFPLSSLDTNVHCTHKP